MTSAQEHSAVLALFERLRQALKAGDLALLREIWVADAAPQEGIFAANAHWMAKEGVEPVLRKVVQLGDEATVTFDLMGRGKEKIDEGKVELALENGEWRIRSF